MARVAIRATARMRETIFFIGSYFLPRNNYSTAEAAKYSDSPPPAPEREGYTFGGWYTEAECVNEWNFDTVPQIAEGEQLRLYAGWEKAA